MSNNCQLLLLLLLSLSSQPSLAFTNSEQGIKEADLTEKSPYMTFAKSLYKSAQILVHVICPGDSSSTASSGNSSSFQVGWLLRQSPCAEEYSEIDKDGRRAPAYYDSPDRMQVKEFDYDRVNVKQYKPDSVGTCLVCRPGQQATLMLPNLDQSAQTSMETRKDQSSFKAAANASDSAASQSRGKPATAGRRRRVAPSPAAAAAAASAISTTLAPSALTTAAPSASKPDLITRTWEDGIYLLVLHAEPCCQAGAKDCNAFSLPSDFRVRARIEIKNTFGYLSAIDWPLLPFFGSMCLLYLLFGLLWLALCAKYWREMLRIQFCISGVIFLGMLEKALFYAEYQSINSSGVSVRGAVMLAELVSCVKRSVARMLVLIVCLGYGIVKPRLGQLQHKVIAIGLVYFVFSAVESSLRSMSPRFNSSRNAFYATIPLAVTDAIICWWIFSSLVQTIRNLRVRRNLVKLSLYRHFTNTLVFCVVCSVVFMAWTVGRHKFAVCIAAWRELWIDDAFWHLLFSVILFVIIVLWRPSQNNQRYAFTPLLDAGNDSDEDEEVVMDNLAEGVKARGPAASAHHQQQQRSRQSSKGEDSLRWVEENIPQSLVESTLPSLLHDSDEEVLTTKYEMSKLL